MANILGIFTAVILAVAAFVAVKNNARLEEEISNKKVELQSLDMSKERLVAAQVENNRLPEEISTLEEDIVVKTAEGVELKEANEALQAALESKTATIAENKAKLDSAREKIAGIGDIEGLATKMKTMGVELQELDQAIVSTEASLANLTATEAAATSRKDDLETLIKGVSLQSLKTRIRNIYPSWGFVTLTDGNSAGVIANLTLDVVRDGGVIAKLLVTAVERGSASASIIPDSIGENATLMVGDQVVVGSSDD